MKNVHRIIANGFLIAEHTGFEEDPFFT